MFTSDVVMFYRDIRSCGTLKSASVPGLLNDLFAQSLETGSRSAQYDVQNNDVTRACPSTVKCGRTLESFPADNKFPSRFLI